MPNQPNEQIDRLCQEVMRRINRRETILNRTRIGGFGALITVALISLVPAVSFLLESISDSGFGQYASILLSDSSYAFSHWQNMCLTMIESLPIMAVATVVAVLLVTLSAFRKFIYYKSLNKQNERLLAIS